MFVDLWPSCKVFKKACFEFIIKSSHCLMLIVQKQKKKGSMAVFSSYAKFFLSTRIRIWSIKLRLIQNKLQIPHINCETNLLSLINLSLRNVYCSITLSNHGVVRLKRFVSQFTCKLCNWFFLSTFNVLCMCLIIWIVPRQNWKFD